METVKHLQDRCAAWFATVCTITGIAVGLFDRSRITLLFETGLCCLYTGMLSFLLGAKTERAEHSDDLSLLIEGLLTAIVIGSVAFGAMYVGQSLSGTVRAVLRQ